jgi:hypothetical protein
MDAQFVNKYHIKYKISCIYNYNLYYNTPHVLNAKYVTSSECLLNNSNLSVREKMLLHTLR